MKQRSYTTVRTLLRPEIRKESAEED